MADPASSGDDSFNEHGKGPAQVANGEDVSASDIGGSAAQQIPTSASSTMISTSSLIKSEGQLSATDMEPGFPIPSSAVPTSIVSEAKSAIQGQDESLTISGHLSASISSTFTFTTPPTSISFEMTTESAKPTHEPTPASITPAPALPLPSDDADKDAHKISPGIIAAIVVPLLLLLMIFSFLGYWLHRRSINQRKARELEKRAEWLDPEYIELVRRELLGLDPDKTSYPSSAADGTKGQDFNELGMVGDMAWRSRGSFRLTSRNVRVSSRGLRTRTTENGSPVALNRKNMGSSITLSEGEWFSIDPSLATTDNNIPPQSEAQSQSQKPHRLPPPFFDPRGSRRESQIGLAIPLPRSLSVSRPYSTAGYGTTGGLLTGDGYEALWLARRARRSRSPLPLPRMPLQGPDDEDDDVKETYLTAITSGSQESTQVGSGSASLKSDDKLNPKPVSGGHASSSDTLSTALALASSETQQQPHSQTRSATTGVNNTTTSTMTTTSRSAAAAAATTTMADDAEQKRNEATRVSSPGAKTSGRRWKVFRGRREVVAGGRQEGAGNDEVVRDVLRERLAGVKGMFGGH